MADAGLSARMVIDRLGLAPHPEGGYFRETFRDPRSIGGRAASTAIYYLLEGGRAARWHRVDVAEVWHWYAGSALTLATSADGAEETRQRLGPRIDAGERPQIVVPAGVWQSAASEGPWTLAGCTVAPGFEFEGFELAADDWRPGP